MSMSVGDKRGKEVQTNKAHLLEKTRTMDDNYAILDSHHNHDFELGG